MPVTVREFTDLLRGGDLGAVVDQHVFADTPYVFRGAPEQFSVLVRHLARALSVADDDVAIVGSGKTGFSLAPDTFGRPFAESSDVDVVVVAPVVFDELWAAMREWGYQMPTRLAGVERNWMNRRMDDVFWGWFVPDRIRYQGLAFPDALKPVRDLSTKWFNTFRSLALYPGLAGHDYVGRLYRTWDHARMYHTDSLSKVRGELRRRGAI